jgi:outer membrane lipoprotein-sorting protein
MALAFLACASVLLSGCAAPTPVDKGLPVYPGLSDGAALKILVDRAAAVHTVQATCSVTLRRGDGDSVQLDGALAMAPPDRMRLRVWKMGQAVFDVTVLPEGVWVEAADRGHADDIRRSTNDTAVVERALGWFIGGFFADPALVQDPSTTTRRIVYWRPEDFGGLVRCDVDRLTLTPRRYRVLDAAGAVRYTLHLSAYQMFAGIAWPTHIVAISTPAPPGELILGGSVISGFMDIVLSDVQINQGLAPEALIPPRNAEKLP